MSGKFPGNFQDKSRTFPGNVREITGKCPGDAWDMLVNFPGDFLDLSRKCSGNVQEISETFPESADAPSEANASGRVDRFQSKKSKTNPNPSP